MNRIFYALIAIAFLWAAQAQLRWVPPEPVATVASTAELPEATEDDPLVAELRALRARVDALDPPKAAPSPPMKAIQDAILERSRAAVELILGLIGAMAFFLGLMKVAERGGLLNILARLIRPVLIRIFPDVPPEHPAMGAMILNLSANALGLGNAATPFGIKAMKELDSLNRHGGTATNAMALFLAINTSSVTLLPTGVIVWREALGSSMAADILPTTLFATLFSTSAAILTATLLSKVWASPEAVTPEADLRELGTFTAEADASAYPGWVSALAMLAVVGLIPLAVIYGAIIAPWLIPSLAVGLLTFGFMRGVAVYEAFVEGAKEGWDLAVRIVPYLVAILAAVGMFQASGAMNALIGIIQPITGPLGLPGEALPMALLRPLSGSGAMGIMVATMQDPATGPDTYTGFLVSTLAGSTETTFYVLAVYFGAVGIQRVRHALAAALTADVAGVIGAIIACQVYFSMNGLW